MSRSMEEILGKKIQRGRYVPGTRAGQAERVRYVALKDDEKPPDGFLAVINQVTGPVPQQGGAVLERCILTLPDGGRFQPISFHGDVAGWQQKIESGARSLGVLSAKIAAEALIISDGRRIFVADCKVHFY